MVTIGQSVELPKQDATTPDSVGLNETLMGFKPYIPSLPVVPSSSSNLDTFLHQQLGDKPLDSKDHKESSTPCPSGSVFSLSTAGSLAGMAGAKYAVDYAKSSTAAGSGFFQFVSDETLSGMKAAGSGLSKLNKIANIFKFGSLLLPLYSVYSDYVDAKKAPSSEKAQAYTRAHINALGVALAAGIACWFSGPLAPFIIFPIVSFLGDQLKAGVGKNGSFGGVLGRAEYQPDKNKNHSIVQSNLTSQPSTSDKSLIFNKPIAVNA